MSAPGAVRATGRFVGGALRLVLTAIAVVVFGAGVPFLWVWVGSQLQGGTAPSFGGLGVALLGIVVSYAALAYFFAWLKQRSNPDAGKPVRYEWNRSLSAERRQPGRTTALEDIAMTATLIVAVVCTIWFLLFGNPGVPVGG